MEVIVAEHDEQSKLTSEERQTEALNTRAQALEARERRAGMLKGSLERREFAVEGMECRTLDDGTIRMGGYGSITERFYDVGDPSRGGFRERISRSAFKRTLGEGPDVVLLANHEGLPLARTKNGSLTLGEDSRGLRWDADLDSEDPESRVLSRKVEKGLLDQCSFAFLCTDDSWNSDFSERTIKSLSLHRGDVSIVTHGANEATTVSLRSAAEALGREERAGKTLSAKTRGELEQIKTSISELLDGTDSAADIEVPAAVEAERAEESEIEIADPVIEVEPVNAPQRIRSLLDYTTGARSWFDQMQEAR
jgi:HK97 family phage prohead protease